MSKPIDLVRFGVDGSDVDATHIAPPDADLRDTGYPLDAVPTSDNFNYFLNRYYRWIQYLNAGNFEGASSFNSTLHVVGNMTLDAALAMAGALTVDGAAIVKGDVTIGGQVAVIADMVFTADNTTDRFTKVAHGLRTGDGPIRVSNSGGALPTGLSGGTDYWVVRISADVFQLSTTLAFAYSGTVVDVTTNGTGTQTLSDTGSTARVSDVLVSRDVVALRSGVFGLDVSVARNLSFAQVVGSALFANGVTAAANQHVQVSGTGRYKHGTLTLVIPARGNQQVATTTLANMTEQIAGNTLLIRIVLPAGKIMTVARVSIDGAASTVFRAQIVDVSQPFGVHADEFGDSNGTAASQDITISALGSGVGIQIAGQTAYYVTVFRQSGAGTGAVYCAEIDYHE